MNITDIRLKNSFTRVKQDILTLRNELYRVGKTQERILEMIYQLKSYETEKINQIMHDLTEHMAKTKQEPVKAAPTSFVAAKKGDKFHVSICPFAKNISEENKVTFLKKEEALAKGYAACRCVE